MRPGLEVFLRSLAFEQMAASLMWTSIFRATHRGRCPDFIPRHISKAFLLIFHDVNSQQMAIARGMAH
jgi:hypothetical protein